LSQLRLSLNKHGLPTIWNQVEATLLSRIPLAEYGHARPIVVNVPRVNGIFSVTKKLAQAVIFPWYISVRNNSWGGAKSILGVMPHIAWYDARGTRMPNYNNHGRWWVFLSQFLFRYFPIADR